MIFSPELVKKIAAGGKTMTRRPVKAGERTCRYLAGHSYAVQAGRGKPGSFRITVVDVRTEHVGNISLRDVRREGFRTTAEFYDYWHRLYGPAPSQGVRVLERRLAELDPDSEAARALVVSIEESRRQRSERLPLPAMPCVARVISFVRGDITEQPRFLRARAPRAPTCTAMVKVTRAGKTVKAKCGRGFEVDQESGQYKRCRCGARPPGDVDEDHYTTRIAQAIRGEAEPIPAKLQDKYAKDVAERDKTKREEMRQRALTAIEDIVPHASDGRERKRLRAAANQIRALGVGIPARSGL
jgi:hypothetical protein